MSAERSARDAEGAALDALRPWFKGLDRLRDVVDSTITAGGDVLGAVMALATRAEVAEADAARLRAVVERVEALADKWEHADGEPVSAEGLAILSTVNRIGRELRAAVKEGQ